VECSATFPEESRNHVHVEHRHLVIIALELRSLNKLADGAIYASICIIKMLLLRAIRRHDFKDITYTAAEVEIWSILEPYLGIINACIPVVQPVLRRLFCIPALQAKKISAEEFASEFSDDRRQRLGV
jgi:hypothetical protein